MTLNKLRIHTFFMTFEGVKCQKAIKIQYIMAIYFLF